VKNEILSNYKGTQRLNIPLFFLNGLNAIVPLRGAMEQVSASFIISMQGHQISRMFEKHFKDAECSTMKLVHIKKLDT